LRAALAHQLNAANCQPPVPNPVLILVIHTWCAKAARKPIIADGGIRTHGDIAKSIRFGATMVMIGSLFAGHEDL
jgi:NAD(P)H-dependent flavin oxidoreductase YrpB (nitropropane dioxygenase family)